MTTASDAEPCASNRCPRWSNGSAEVILTELAFVATASPSAPCDSADDAVAESATSTMYEMPSPSAMAWLSLLTRRDRVGPVQTGRHSFRPIQGMRLASLALVGLLMAVGAAGARAVTGTAGNDRLTGDAAG